MVELWMSEVDDAMKDALIHYTFTAMTEWNYQPDMEYLERFPGQCIYCASAISWTKLVTETIQAGSKWSVSSPTEMRLPYMNNISILIVEMNNRTWTRCALCWCNISYR